MTARMTDIKDAVDGLRETNEVFITQQKERVEKLRKDNEDLRDRLEILESAKNSPGRTASGETKQQHDHQQLFTKWLRKPNDIELKNRLAELESKTVTIGSDPGGGFAVPEQIAREIERLELLLSPVRRLVKIMQIGSSDFKHLVNLRGATSGWVGESGSRTETSTPLLREVTPTHGELYAYPKVSEWALDDIFFNVEQWLAEEVAQEFAVQEGQAVIDGNGTNKLTGMINTVPVSTADFASPLRAAAAYQFITSSTGTSPAAPTSIAADSLIDVIYKLRSEYRAGAVFVMNSATMGVVRKLKDTQNQYLWQPGMQAGQPNLLLGFAVETWEQMPNIGANNFPIAFGNFRRGYVLTQRTSLRITRDDVTSVGFVRFYVRRREGGIVLNNDAIKWIKTVD